MPRHSRTCHSAELLQCRSQIRDKLDSNKQRQSKWTTDAELAVLTKLWGCMARRRGATRRSGLRLHVQQAPKGQNGRNLLQREGREVTLGVAVGVDVDGILKVSNYELLIVTSGWMEDFD